MSTTRTTTTRRPVLAALLLALVVVLGACGGDAGRPADTASSAPARSVGAPDADPPSVDVAAESTARRVARPTTATEVHDQPGGEVVQVLPETTSFGSARALLVVADAPGWLHVQLPTRPNGSTGWIRAEGVEVREVSLAVHVDLASRRLTVVDGDAVVLESPVAVGAPGTPTPVGTFFVTDKLVTEDPGGPYGPFALGLSVHSEVLTEFAGGDGQVGIHGTNDPNSIGADVSNGCVRVPNDVIAALDELLPLGTPVVVS